MPQSAKTTSDSTWCRDGLRFRCTQCGRCCGGPPGFVWVDADEIREIAAFLDLSEPETRRRHTRRRRGRRSLLERPNGDCQFLVHEPNGRTSCAIHAVRPLQCRTWPFWQSNMRSRRTWEAAARDCPGMNQGKLYSLRVIRQALAQNEAANLDL